MDKGEKEKAKDTKERNKQHSQEKSTEKTISIKNPSVKKQKKLKIKTKEKKSLVEEKLNLSKETQSKSETHEESNRRRSVEGNKAWAEDKRKVKNIIQESVCKVSFLRDCDF